MTGGEGKTKMILDSCSNVHMASSFTFNRYDHPHITNNLHQYHSYVRLNMERYTYLVLALLIRSFRSRYIPVGRSPLLTWSQRAVSHSGHLSGLHFATCAVHATGICTKKTALSCGMIGCRDPGIPPIVNPIFSERSRLD